MIAKEQLPTSTKEKATYLLITGERVFTLSPNVKTKTRFE
jgi:hypothetical protein